MCYEEMSLKLGDQESDMDPPTETCNHDRNVCDSCLKASYESAIASASTRLTCPDPDCRADVPLERVRHVVSKKSFRL